MTLRSGRKRRFDPRHVAGGSRSERFERWVARQEARAPEYGPIAGLLMALRFYCDPTARCVRWYLVQA